MPRRTFLAASATTAASAADYTTTVNPGTSWGAWEGWGRWRATGSTGTRRTTTVSGSGGNGLVGRWATRTAGGDAYTYHADTFLPGKVFWSWFTTNTVQTFEIGGVCL
jgi:hypothetical protein